MVRTAARPLCWPGPGKCLWIVHSVGFKATTACPVQITPSSFTDVTTSVRCLTCRHRLLTTSVQASVRCSHLLEAHPCHSRTSSCISRLRLCPLWALIRRNHCSPLRLFRRTRHQCLHHLRLLLPWTFRLSRLSSPQWTVHLTLPWIRLHLLQIPMRKWRVALRLGPLLPYPCRHLPLSALPSGLVCLRSPALRSSFLITAPMWCMPSVPRLTRTCWLSPTRRILKPSSALPAAHAHRRPSARQSAARFRLQPRHVCAVLARPLAPSISGVCALGPFAPRFYLRFFSYPVPAAACPLTTACLARRAENSAHLVLACLSAFCTDLLSQVPSVASFLKPRT